jgi:membrane associated rhomboid family serine protease
MRLVLLTAAAVWVLMLVMNVVDVGGFIVESSIAVLGGAAIGLIGSWYMRRQERKERRA